MQEVDDHYTQKRKVTSNSNQITENDLIEKTENNDTDTLENTKKLMGKKIKNELFERNMEKFKKQIEDDLKIEFERVFSRINKMDDENK